MKRRLFIAINLPENVKKKLVEYREKWYNLNPELIRWVNKFNLHITLVFIGYVSDDEMYNICNIVKETAKKHEPFFIRMERIIIGPAYDKSSAGKPSIPRMFWVEGEKSEELAKLQTDLENAIAGEDYIKKEIRPYKPHITLARFRSLLLKSLPEEINEPFKFEIPVETIEVMESSLKRTGAEYSVLESVELGKL